MTGSIDTNALLSYATNRDPKQMQMVKKLFSERIIHASDQVFIEMEYVLRYGYEMERSKVSYVIIGVIADSRLNCNRAMLVKALALYEERPSLSFVDCCITIQAELNNALPLYTFDKKLVNQSSGRAKLLK